MKKMVLAVFWVILLTMDVQAQAYNVLVVGFGPWDIYDVNPSELIAESLDGQEILGANIIGVFPPVDFEASVEVITQAIEDFDPVVVICIGLDPDYRLITIENIGTNLKYDYLAEDPKREFNDSNGPLLRFSTLPTRQIVRYLRRFDIPARHGFNAGTYICNAVLYGTLGYIRENELSTKAGFIHVPPLLSQDEEKGLELETMIDAVKIAIKVSLLDFYFDNIYIIK